jgi:hypothetical protein
MKDGETREHKSRGKNGRSAAGTLLCIGRPSRTGFCEVSSPYITNPNHCAERLKEDRMHIIMRQYEAVMYGHDPISV